MGPYDQRPIEMRTDVLGYTSAPMPEDLEVTGFIEMVLFAATDAIDTDWTAKLVDVAPSGYAKNLCDGIIRARYRAGCTELMLLTPGQLHEYRSDLGVTANVFLRGHAVRLEVSSSSFPRYDRNPNTGSTFGTDAEMQQARQEFI